MNIFTKRIVTCIFMAATAFATVVSGSQSAAAGSCSVVCPGGVCSIKKWFRAVMCVCDSEGRPVCTTAYKRTSEPVEMLVAADGSVHVVATEEQLADLRENIAAAEEFEYFRLAEATARVYEALENGNAEAYAEALDVYEQEIHNLKPEDWARLEAASQ